jgi:cytochrome P450
MIRTVEQPVERFGPAMCPGDKIVYAVASANRDERIFDDPDTWRLDRENGREHLAFGDGPHICPGMAIARLEGKVTTEVFVERVGAVTPAADWEYRKVPVFWACGPVDLRVSLTAR